MFAYKSIECLHQLLKSRHLFVRFISLNPYILYGISQTWKSGIMKKKGKKESKSIVSAAYIIADVSVSTNPIMYANIVFK